MKRFFVFLRGWLWRQPRPGAAVVATEPPAPPVAGIDSDPPVSDASDASERVERDRDEGRESDQYDTSWINDTTWTVPESETLERLAAKIQAGVSPYDAARAQFRR